MSNQFASKLAGAVMLWLVIGLSSFFIAAACVDGEGRKAWHHVGPVPAHVERLSGTDYLIGPAATAMPDDLCETSSAYSPIESVKRLPGREDVFVKCNRTQTWGDTRAQSPDYTTAMTDVGESPVSYVVLIALALALAAIPGSQWFKDREMTA